MPHTHIDKDGSISLIGAGPGDVGLITARGLRLLRQAEVVVFDALVNPDLLEQAPAQAQRICVGKRAGAHEWSQDQINQLLVDLAQKGQMIVRLKGGDPYLFGRGAEEVAYVTGCGVRCEVVPGVTAGIAVPAAAGIPVTHRRLASTVTFVTGHEDPTKEQPSIDYASLAGLILAGGTVCFYMGVERLRAIADQLCDCHVVPGTPVAVIQWGTLPRQRMVRSNLASAASDAMAAGLGAPAMIVVGGVADLKEPGLECFTNRPLFGQCVVITRARHQAVELRQRLDDLGADTLEAPTIEVLPPADWSPVDQAMREFDQFDWLVLTSVNGVVALRERLDTLGLDARSLGAVKIAVIGDATAQAMVQNLHIRADLIPDQFVAESLAQSLINHGEIRGKRLLLLRADIARQTLPELLRDGGGQITDLVVYRNQSAAVLPTMVLEAMRCGRVDWITFTSSSTARHMVQLLGEDRGLLEKVKIASIGPVTSRALRQLDLEPTVEAKTFNLAGLVAAMVEVSDMA